MINHGRAGGDKEYKHEHRALGIGKAYGGLLG